MNLPEGFEYLPGFLPADEADRLFERLLEEVDWRQQRVLLFGRRLPQPRLTAWCSDPGVCYRYSGLELQPGPWLRPLQGLRHQLGTRTGAAFNSVLLNLYRDGRDSMGWHADDEPELGEAPVIASVSLGAVRRLRVRPRGGGPSRAVDLAPGSLLLMRGRSQADWQHAVPRTARQVGPRINLTFREIQVAG